MDLPLKQIKALLKTLEEGGVGEFEYEDEKHRLRVVRGSSGQWVAAPPSMGPMHSLPPVASVMPGAAPTAAPAASEDADIAFVTSPFVGTFYRAPSPESAVFTEVGASVKPGQALCIVEAMKLMNEIECDVAGTVIEVLAENGASVEFGQKLFKIKKA
jgi:acetyl-CoA carboxylase biotin carboxyl carrier protein